MTLSHFLTFTISRKSNQGILSVAAKILIGLSLAVPLFTLSLFAVLVGGASAGVLGLRNLGEYTLKEEFVAWSPVILLLATAPAWASSYFLGKMSLILCFAVLLIGFDFLFGQCGILTLGHAGFAYLGAFFTGFLSNGTFGIQLPFFISAIVASLAVAGIGFILGLPSLRVKDQYLVVVTLAFALSIGRVFRSRYLSQYSGMAVGGLSIEQPRFFTLLTKAEGEVQNYIYILLSTLVLTFIAHNLIRRSQIGRAFRIIKCDHEVSMILGVSFLRYKLLAFALSAFYAAYAGSMAMLLTKFVSIDSYTIFEAIDYYVAIILGGVGSILGAAIGAIFLGFEVDITRSFGQLIPKGEHLARVFYGVLLIVTIYIGPKGIANVLSGFASSTLLGRVRRGMHYMFPPADYSASENRNSPLKEK